MKLVRSVPRIVLRNKDSKFIAAKLSLAAVAILWSQFVSITDAFTISTLLLFQLYIGAQYYLIFKKSLNTTLWEAIAIGGSTYFGLVGIVAVLLPRQGVLISILSVVPLVVVRCRRNRFGTNEKNIQVGEDFFQAELLITTTLFGLSIFYNNFIPLCFCLIIAFIVGQKKSIYEKLFKTSWQSRNAVFWIVFYFGLFFDRLVGSHKRPFNGLMTQLFRGSDDQIFSEQMAHSLVNFGMYENSAAIGSEIKYHWLSLGWSGLISQITGAEPFVVTLHVVPVISYFMLSILIAQFVLTMTKEIWVSILVTINMFGFQLMGSQIGFLEVLNTSNIFPFIWFLALIITLRDSYRVFNARTVVIVALLAMFCALGKAPYALAIAVGSIFVFAFHFFKNRFVSLKMFLTLGSVGFPMLFIYIFLIRGETYGSAFSFSWKSLYSSFPSPLYIGDASVLGILISITTVISISLVPVFFLYYQKNFSDDPQEFNYLISGVICSGVFSIVLDAGGSTTYFLSAAIFATILLSAYSLELLLKSNNLRFRLLIMAVSLSGAVFTLVLRIGKAKSGIFQENGYFAGIGILLQVVVPFCLVLLLHRIWFTGKYAKHLLLAAVACCSIFFAVFSVVTERAYSQLIYEETAPNYAPDDELEALQWLRDNSQLDDVLVTNRMLCKNSFICDNGDRNTGSSHLISAFSERRVVIEGPRFLAPSPYVNANSYPEWITERVTNSLQFIDYPNKDNYQTIRTYGTTFAYVLKEQTLNRSWTPWASIVFENNSVIILELSGSSINRLSS